MVWRRCGAAVVLAATMFTISGCGGKGDDSGGGDEDKVLPKVHRQVEAPVCKQNKMLETPLATRSVLAAKRLEPITVPWDSKTFSLGKGFDSATGKIRTDKCITTVKPKPNSETGQKIDVTFKAVTSSSEMQEELGLSIGASYSGFGVSASAQAKYGQSASLSKYESAFMLKVTVTQGQRKELDRSAEFVESMNTRLDRDEICGDSYIAEAVMGGTFYAVVKTSKEAVTKAQSMEVDVSGEGFGGQLSAKMSTAFSAASETGQTNVIVLSVGGNGEDWEKDGGIPTDAAGLLKKAMTFPAAVQNHPVALEARIFPYSQLSLNYNAGNSLAVQYARDQVNYLMSLYTLVAEWSNTVNYIKDPRHKAEFNESIRTGCIRTLEPQLQTTLHAITNAADALSQDYKAAIDVIDVPDPCCLPETPMSVTRTTTTIIITTTTTTTTCGESNCAKATCADPYECSSYDSKTCVSNKCVPEPTCDVTLYADTGCGGDSYRFRVFASMGAVNYQMKDPWRGWSGPGAWSAVISTGCLSMFYMDDDAGDKCPWDDTGYQVIGKIDGQCRDLEYTLQADICGLKMKAKPATFSASTRNFNSTMALV